jgi:hypothetical protein
MKTDLTKILSVSGQRGLFLYLAQARNGVVVEALSDKRRTVFDAKSRVTTLADISIFTTDGEVKLRDVLLKLKEVLGDREAPSAKASSEEVKELFAEAVPNYDPDRFYASHMKKILDWYAELKQYASFDFVDPDQEKEAEDNGGEALE